MTKEAKKKIENTVKTVRKIVRHKYTKDELFELQKNLASATIELRHKESEKKAIVAQYGSAIEQLKSTTAALADKASAGFEFQSMECKVIFNWEKGRKTTIHPETGEQIAEEDITQEDRKQELPLEN